jgi:hypothetical protein
VIAELAGGLVEHRAGLIVLQWRQWIFAPARRLEDVAAENFLAEQIAGLAGDADLVLGLVVERLQVRIAQRPVGERGVGGDRGLAVALDGVGAGAEIVLMKSP